MMKAITDREARVLSRFEFDPQQRAEVVGKNLRLKTSTVSYTLRRLEERGLIRQQAIINPYLLGYIDVAMFFSLIDRGHPDRKKLLNRIASHDRVIHLGSLLGDYHYLVIFLCRSLGEIRTFLQELFVGAGDVFSDKLIAPRTSITLFQRKYLDPKLSKPRSITIEPGPELVQIDELDERILQALGAAPFESLRRLSASLGLPFSTVERRVSKLKASGVVPGFYYYVDTDRIGVQAFRLLVMKKGICHSTRQKLFEFCQEHPQITFLIESIGAWDFEIGVEAADSSVVTRVVEELYGICGMRIASVKVLTEVKDFKCCYYPLGLPTSTAADAVKLAGSRSL